MSQLTDSGFSDGSLGVQIDAAREKNLSTSAVIADRDKARTLGWSSALVRDNREEAEREISKRTISSNELFASWAKESAENAAVALEDTGAMLAAFDALQQEKQRQALLTKAEKMGVAFERGAAQVYQQLLGFGELLAETGASQSLQNMFVDDDMGDYLTPDTSGQVKELRRKRHESLQGMPAPLMDSNLAYDVIESAPQMLLQIGASTAGTVLGGPVGGVAASMGMMTPLIAGGQYGNLRDEGISVENASIAAIVNAGVQAPLESISMSRFLSIFKASGMKAVGKAALQGMATEYATEFVQHYPEVATDIWARMEERGESGLIKAFVDRLPQTHREGHHEGSIGAIWGLLGGGSRLGYERAHAARAADWRGRMTEFYERFSATKIKQESPEVAQGIIEHAGMDGDAFVDSEEALRLFQSGALDLDVLEITEQQLTEAAALGQDIPVKAARLAAYAKDKAEFDSLISITRDVPYAETVAEIEREGRKQEDIDRVIEVLKEQTTLEEAFNSEVARMETEIAAAVEETDTLQRQAATLAEGSAAYAKTEAARLAEFARRNHPDPEQRVAFLRKLRFLGPDAVRLEQSHREADAAGRFGPAWEGEEFSLPPDSGPLPNLEDLGGLLTVNEYMDLLEEQERMAALGITADMTELQQLRATVPWLGAIWGRLDGKSLRETWPQAFDEIKRNYGLGLFRSAEKGGLAVDLLADELVRDNIFQQDMGADELVERLKTPRGGLRLFQAADSVQNAAPFTAGAVNHNAQEQFATLTPIAASVSQLEGARREGEPVLRSLADWAERNGVLGTYKNTLSGLDNIQVTKASIKAVAQHKAGDGKLALLRIVPEMIRNGVYVTTVQRNTEGVLSHIFAAKVKLDTEPHIVGFIVNEDMNGRRYYNHEMAVVEALGQTQEPQSRPVSGHGVSSRSTSNRESVINIIRRHLNVNPDTVLLQAAKNIRGSLEITPEHYTVIFDRKHANLSTLTHETGHIFEAELRRIVNSGLADERQTADLATLDTWLSRFDDDAALKAEYNSRLKKVYFKNRSFDRLSATEREQARGLAKREYFARGFELYAREGKAPSEGLRGVFDRFKRWLLEMYKDAKRLGVAINDDVRGAFDRMLVTERELEETAAVNELFTLTQAELDKLGVKGADRQYMAGLMTAAREKAAAHVERDRLRERNARIRQWAEEARAELMRDPVYIARAELRQAGKHLNADALAATLGEEAAAALRKHIGPQAVRKEGGQDPRLFAVAHGFTDAAHMLSALTSVPGLGKRINEIVAEREAIHDAQVDPAPYLLRTEEAARQIAMTGKYLAESLGKSAVQDKALQTVANARLQNMSMGQARNHLTFVAAMRRALKRERSAVARGDMEAALTANTQARINLEFARRSLDIEEARKRAEDMAKRFVKSAKADVAARHAVNVLAAKYDLMPFDERLAGGKSWETIAKWYADRQAEGYPLAPDQGMYMAENRPWRELTWREFSDVAEEMRMVVTVERNQRKLLKESAKADFKEVIQDLAGEVAANHTLKPVKILEGEGAIKSGFKKVHAAHLKIEVLLRILDGDKDLGENWSRIYKPINDSAMKRGRYFKALNERLQSEVVFGAYTDKERHEMSTKKEYVPEVGESVTKEQRIMAALNMGNVGNYERLKAGGNWNDTQIAALIQTLDSRDWNFVQNIWDTFEQYKEEAFALQEKITGQRPTEVKAFPFTVRASDGQIINMRGGYFPVMYAHAQADPKLQDQFLAGQQPSFAMTRHGHLKERTATGAGTALRLEFTAIPKALQDVITDITFREAMIDVGRILRNREYRHAVEGAVGREMYQAMVDWLKNVAGERRVPTAGEGMARWARRSASIMALGLKATTVIMQPFGITQTVDRIGWGQTMQGLAEAYGGGWAGVREKTAWVRSVSPFMENRVNSYDREVADATSDFEKVQLDPQGLLDAVTPQAIRKVEEWVRKNAFVPIGVTQFYGVDLPTWLAAYDKGMKDFHADEAKAIDYADHMVRLTQGAGETHNLSQIQRGSEYGKLFTMFYTYFSQLYALLSLRTYDVSKSHDMASAMRAANSFLMLIVIPAVVTELAVRRGPEDDEEYWKWAAKLIAMYPFQSVIGVRDVARFVDGKYGYSASPAQDAPESVYNLLRQVADIAADPEKFDLKKLGKLTLRTYGYAKGLPLKQPEISAFNVIDYLDGTSGDFEALDLLFTRQKDRR